MDYLNKIGTNKDCTAAIIVRDGQVLMGNRRYYTDRETWIFPGGRCDEGETLSMTLVREVAEEVGINDLNITSYISNKKGIAEGDTLYIFKCATNQEPKLLEPEKFVEWKWFSPDNLPEGMTDPEDKKVIAAALGL